MARFDVLDEVIINAKPDVVYKAILSGAFRGTDADFKLLKGSNSYQLGALTEITLPGRFPVKFTIKPLRLKRTSYGALSM